MITRTTASFHLGKEVKKGTLVIGYACCPSGPPRKRTDVAMATWIAQRQRNGNPPQGEHQAILDPSVNEHLDCQKRTKE